MSDLHGNPHAEAIDPSGVTVEARAYLAVAYELRTANLLAYLNHTESDEYEPTHRETRARLGLTEGAA